MSKKEIFYRYGFSDLLLEKQQHQDISKFATITFSNGKKQNAKMKMVTYVSVKMSNSYHVEVETFGEGNRSVLVHTSKSKLENWIQEDYDKRQEIIDKLFNADFNYDIEKFSEENIYNELIGDRMGFTGQPKDYNYTITKIINIEPITMKQIKYVAKTYKDFF